MNFNTWNSQWFKFREKSLFNVLLKSYPFFHSLTELIFYKQTSNYIIGNTKCKDSIWPTFTQTNTVKDWNINYVLKSKMKSC
jgi:hypothetical protein